MALTDQRSLTRQRILNSSESDNNVKAAGGRQLPPVVRGNSGSGNKSGTVTHLLHLAATC